jgi:hypothetical protein
MFCRVAFFTLGVVGMCLTTTLAKEITAERSPGGVILKINGQLFTEYLVRSGTKPILWPIIGPSGKPMTRAYPMKMGTKEVADHIHQRSLWFTHGAVNGVDFWGENPGKGGMIKHREFVKIVGGQRAVIVTRNDWIGPTGMKICEDERNLAFGADSDTRWIDFDVTVKATEGPVTFGDTKEGTFAVRVADTMRGNAKKGGRIVNSRGQTNDDAWAKPAEWVDYHGPVDGETVGIAILNHPSSFRFPTYWHVRTYGLFAANPFGLNEFTKGTKQGPNTLSAGESMSLRYRVLLHGGDEKRAKVAQAFAEYAKEKR